MATRHRPVEKIMSVADTKQHFSEVLGEVARGESYVVVEKSGAPVAAIISQQELEEYRRLREENQATRERLHQSMMEFSRRLEDIPEDELERVLAEAHREYREKTDREHGLL